MPKARVLVCLAMAVVLAASVSSVAQTADTYQVTYFSNANITVHGDQVIRIANPGMQGSPLGSNSDICANLYVFDANRTMQSCCSCEVAPNGMIGLRLRKDLLQHPVDATTPSRGVIKLVSSSLSKNAESCDPTSVAPAANLRASMEHLDLLVPSAKVPLNSASTTPFLSVASFEPAELSMYELENLLSACESIVATNACTCGTQPLP